MAKKKSRPSARAKAAVGTRVTARRVKPTKKATSRAKWVAGILGAVLIVVIAVVVSNGSRGATASSANRSSGNLGAPADEAKYLGRLLPAGYEEPKVTGTTIYTGPAAAKQVLAADAGTAISVALDQITSNRIVLFDYARPGSAAIPVIAYVKPSGKLFVGVSYCPPCQGRGQRIEPDVTLTCETCGTKRQLESMIGVSGACKLYPLDEVPAKVEAGRLIVDKALLDKWAPQPLDRPIGG